MNFRTLYKTQQKEKSLSHKSKIFLIGSCFSEQIGSKLSYYKFNTCINPYGILFNPKSIVMALSEIIAKKIYTPKELFKHNDLWHSWQHHSVFSNENPGEALQNINQNISKANEALLKATHLFITLGSAWTYLFQGKTFVANCHKVPENAFTKHLLPTEEIKKDFKALFRELYRCNQGVKIICTLSPVRHLKDGFTQNSISKAHLLSAIYALCQDKNTCYFPAFEICMDDLRDYRFYDSDMLHPNQTAVEYIWKYFSEMFFTDKTLEILPKIQELQKDKHHKILRPNSPQAKKFLERLKEKQEYLAKQYKIYF